MYRFWDSVIEPIADAAGARVVVEVGSWRGHLTRRLLFWCRAHGAQLHVIDPRPKYNADGLSARWEPTLTFHRTLSLRALQEIDAPDLVLIDGDHNWYTVFNELQLLDRAAVTAGGAAPIIMLHDVDWPYGRRDLYYDADTIPPEYVHPTGTLGMVPGRSDLVAGGLNEGAVHALAEGGPRNGVRTAIEDFLAESPRQWEPSYIPGDHGLAVLVETSQARAKDTLRMALDRLDSPDFLRERSARLESPTAARASIVVLVHDTPVEARDLLESIARHTPGPHEVLLVDNGSGEPARAELTELAHRSGARLLRNENNETFAVATNAAVRATTGSEVVLLNSDCVVTTGWLDNLQRALRSAPDVAAVGPRSNSAHLGQGGIWLDDTSQKGIDRFARSFNHPDPARWFEVDWLIGFAMLISREAFDAVDGFDETIRTGAGEDRDLCERLRGMGWQLLCAGDTFVWHLGQRTYARAGINRTATRYGGTPSQALGSSDEPPGRLLRDAEGRVFEIADGVAHHIETATVLSLVRDGRPVDDIADGELSAATFGPPVFLCRARESNDVWVVHRGRRRRVTGDPQRIRRLPGLSIADPAELGTLPAGTDVAVETAIEAPPEIKELIPRPRSLKPKGPEALAKVNAALAAALDQRSGYSLITLGEPDLIALNDGAWPHPAAGSAAPELPPESIRRALVDADVVGRTWTGDSLLEQLLFHLDIYPPMLLDSDATARLAELESVLARYRTTAVAVANPDDLDARFGELASGRSDYDAVVVTGGAAAAVLCGRLARELDAVAIHRR